MCFLSPFDKPFYSYSQILKIEENYKFCYMYQRRVRSQELSDELADFNIIYLPLGLEDKCLVVCGMLPALSPKELFILLSNGCFQ